MEPVNVWLAFIGGLLSFLSPCILPLAPGYLGIISGASVADLLQEPDTGQKRGTRNRVIKATLAFILGFTLVFILLGLTSSYLGQLLRSNRGVIMQIGGIIIIVLGLHQGGWLRIPWLYRQLRLNVGRFPGMAGAFLTGVAFSFGWTPCTGPILGSILMLAGNQANLAIGVAMLIVYSIGLALPFVLLALAFEKISKGLNRLKPYMKYIEWASGILLIIMGVLLSTGNFSRLLSWFMQITGGWNLEALLEQLKR